MQISRLEVEILLNQVCQGVQPIREVEELLEHDDSAKLLWSSLSLMVYQSHPTKLDIEEAVEVSKLKATYTPCVMLLKDQGQSQIYKVADLPRDEWHKALHLLVAVFQISDGKRKAKCGPKCGHAWHQDLANEDVVAAILEQGYM